MPDFHEIQPPRAPRWLPLVLETELSAAALRYRTRRGGPWHEVARADILAADVVTLARCAGVGRTRAVWPPAASSW